MLFWGLAELIFNFFAGAKCRYRSAANGLALTLVTEFKKHQLATNVE